MSSANILVVFGASGAGKTATVQELDARKIPGVQCFYFDSIGVPSGEATERDFGSGENWQSAMTAEWLRRLGSLSTEAETLLLEGQTRPSYVLDAAKQAGPRVTQMVLFDCIPDVRNARLHGPRQQPDLANHQMDCWAAYLRGQADALKLPVIDTSLLTLREAADQLEAVMLGFRRSQSQP